MDSIPQQIQHLETRLQSQVALCSRHAIAEEIRELSGKETLISSNDIARDDEYLAECQSIANKLWVIRGLLSELNCLDNDSPDLESAIFNLKKLCVKLQDLGSLNQTKVLIEIQSAIDKRKALLKSAVEKRRKTFWSISNGSFSVNSETIPFRDFHRVCKDFGGDTLDEEFFRWSKGCLCLLTKGKNLCIKDTTLCVEDSSHHNPLDSLAVYVDFVNMLMEDSIVSSADRAATLVLECLQQELIPVLSEQLLIEKLHKRPLVELTVLNDKMKSFNWFHSQYSEIDVLIDDLSSVWCEKNLNAATENIKNFVKEKVLNNQWWFKDENLESQKGDEWNSQWDEDWNANNTTSKEGDWGWDEDLQLDEDTPKTTQIPKHLFSYIQKYLESFNKFSQKVECSVEELKEEYFYLANKLVTCSYVLLCSMVISKRSRNGYPSRMLLVADFQKLAQWVKSQTNQPLKEFDNLIKRSVLSVKKQKLDHLMTLVPKSPSPIFSDPNQQDQREYVFWVLGKIENFCTSELEPLFEDKYNAPLGKEIVAEVLQEFDKYLYDGFMRRTSISADESFVLADFIDGYLQSTKSFGVSYRALENVSFILKARLHEIKIELLQGRFDSMGQEALMHLVGALFEDSEFRRDLFNEILLR